MNSCSHKQRQCSELCYSSLPPRSLARVDLITVGHEQHTCTGEYRSCVPCTGLELIELQADHEEKGSRLYTCASQSCAILHPAVCTTSCVSSWLPLVEASVLLWLEGHLAPLWRLSPLGQYPHPTSYVHGVSDLHYARKCSKIRLSQKLL